MTSKPLPTDSGLHSRHTIGGKVRYAFEVWAVQRFDFTLNSPEVKEISDSSYEFAREAVDQSYEKLESVLVSILKGYGKYSLNQKALSAKKMAHILTSAAPGFKLVAKNATELREMIQDLVVIIVAS